MGQAELASEQLHTEERKTNTQNPTFVHSQDNFNFFQFHRSRRFPNSQIFTGTKSSNPLSITAKRKNGHWELPKDGI